MGFPDNLLGIFIAAGESPKLATAVLTASVVIWSSRTPPKNGFVIAFLGVSRLDSCPHNPEVAGSNPVPATKKSLRIL